MSVFKSLCVGVIGAVALVGCGSEPQTAQEIRREYAMRILDGFSIKYFDISAARADPSTFTLYDLTLQDGNSIFHADEAWILVDEKTRTVSLQLKGVVGADAVTGQLVSMDDLNSGPIKLAGALKK